MQNYIFTALTANKLKRLPFGQDFPTKTKESYNEVNFVDRSTDKSLEH